MTLIEKTLISLTLFFLLAVASSEVFSFDIFWQLHSGRYMIETKSFIYKDLFSLAADVPRSEHCWLHDIIFYGAYIIGGFSGISVLKGMIIFATGIAAVAAARVRGSSPASILLITLPAIFYTWKAWLERPQLWTFLFFALFLLILESHRKAPRRTIWFLFPLMILWVNLHAGAILAFPVIGAYMVGGGLPRLLKRSSLPPSAWKQLSLVAASLVLASLLTPYDSNILNALISAPKLGVDSGHIAQKYNIDWFPSSFASHPGYFYAMGITFLMLFSRWKGLSLTDLLLFGGLALMGLKLYRHTTFFYLAMAALLPRYFDAIAELIADRFSKIKLHAINKISTILAVMVIIYSVQPIYKTKGFFDTGLRDWHYPVAAAEFVRQNSLPANLFNTYAWGGYLMWALYPDYLVFFDGRSDSIEMFAQGVKVQHGEKEWQEILDRYKVNTIITKALTMHTGVHHSIISRLRRNKLWALVFAGQTDMVFVRRESVDQDWLQSHQLPDHRISDTILSEALLLTRTSPKLYNAWGEMASIYRARGQNTLALKALEKYMIYSPVPDPGMKRLYLRLKGMIKK